MADRILESFMLERRSQRLCDGALARTRNLTLVLDGTHDSHNLSAVLRTAEAFGILSVHVVESTERFRLNRKVTQGVEKWIELKRYRTPEECVVNLQREGFPIWCALPRPGCASVDELPWENKLALVFGNEHAGVSKTLRDAAQGCFTVPMYGFCESLNVSVATGICLAIGVRERTRRLGRHGDLSAPEREALVETWQRRSVKHAQKIVDHLTHLRLNRTDQVR